MNENNPACLLTPAELRQRKETVLRQLRTKIKGKSELPNGYSFDFSGEDLVMDELVEFIRTERECCNFFQFDLSIKGDKSGIQLHLTGPPGVKVFIRNELGFLG